MKKNIEILAIYALLLLISSCYPHTITDNRCLYTKATIKEKKTLWKKQDTTFIGKGVDLYNKSYKIFIEFKIPQYRDTNLKVILDNKICWSGTYIGEGIYQDSIVMSNYNQEQKKPAYFDYKKRINQSKIKIQIIANDGTFCWEQIVDANNEHISINSYVLNSTQKREWAITYRNNYYYKNSVSDNYIKKFKNKYRKILLVQN